MSIEAKQTILKQLEHQFSNSLTANNMDVVLKIIADELDKYDVESNSEEIENGLDSNDMLDAFLTAKELEGRSPKTLERYKYILIRFLKFAKVSIRSVTIYHLRRYLMVLKERGCADSTIEGIREVFSSFFNWLQKENLIDNNPCVNLAPIKCARKERLPFSNADIEKLKEGCKTTRDKTLVCFLLSTGCRVSEVTQLNRENINLQTNQCTVCGKGNKERVVYIDEVASLMLKRYLTERKDNLPALFIGKRHERLTPDGIRFMLNKLGERASVENVHPHRFRRTLATNLIYRGMPIQEVAKILGHEKLDTTMKYVYLDKTNLQFSYDKFTK